LAENPTNYFSPHSIFEECTIGTRQERDGMGFVFSLSVFVGKIPQRILTEKILWTGY